MKLSKILFRIIIAISCIILIGTAGFGDLESITLSQILSQIVWAFVLLGIGALGLRVVSVREKRILYSLKRYKRFQMNMEEEWSRGA